jgi:hypothetical protein
LSTHPYKNKSSRSFWSRSVSENFASQDLINAGDALLNLGDKVTSAGSCFASNLIPFIEKAGLNYVRTEVLPEVFSSMGQNLGYADFSAAYGNIYTARQLKQLYQRANGDFEPLDDRYEFNNAIFDLLRPGLKFTASSNEEFNRITKQHLTSTKKAFELADVFVFTFGLTEGWVSTLDGTTYPACPGTIAGEFDEGKYSFRNFSVHEIVDDVAWFIENLRKHNPKIRFIFSVSPVPLVATATRNHVLTASIYSKSVLRVAAEEICKNHNDATYFPAYEMITGPQAPKEFFEVDRRNVSIQGVEAVMNSLLLSSGLMIDSDFDNNKRRFQPKGESPISELSRRVAVADCDEVLLDENF